MNQKKVPIIFYFQIKSFPACELNITYPNLTEFGVQPIADESGSLCDRRTPQMPMESMEVKRFSRNGNFFGYFMNYISLIRNYGSAK